MTELEQYINTYFGIQKKLDKLAELFTETQITKGDYFSKQNSKCNQLSFIKSGNLRVYANIDGKEITQWISSKDEFITDLSSFMFDNPSRWNIQALSDCKLYTINQSNYKKINDLIPEWSQIEKLFLIKCFSIIEARVFSFLSMSAEERYNHLFESNKTLFNQVPLHYLASMLGMTPETLSRIRKI